MRFQDYNLKFQEHTAISIQWAGVERELLTILHACTEEQQMERFHDAAEHFDASLKRQPLLPPLRFFKNEKGKPLFELITERGGHEEKASNLLAMRALLKEPSGTDLLVGAPDTDTDYTIGCGLQTLAGWPVSCYSPTRKRSTSKDVAKGRRLQECTYPYNLALDRDGRLAPFSRGVRGDARGHVGRVRLVHGVHGDVVGGAVRGARCGCEL